MSPAPLLLREDVPRIYFDGEARPSRNGRLRAALVIVLSGEARTYQWPVGRGDSHLAEWRAAVLGARMAEELGFARCELIGDHVGVIEQADGLVKRRASDPAIVPLLEELTEIRTRCAIAMVHVQRHLNLAGRLLEVGDTPGFRTGVRLLEGAEVRHCTTGGMKGPREPEHAVEEAAPAPGMR